MPPLVSEFGLPMSRRDRFGGYGIVSMAACDQKHGSIGGLKEHAPSQTFRQPIARRVCSATGFQQARYYLPFLDLRGSDASTLRTSDWEIPNCLAMREGVIPALKVARTALTWPCVNATLGSSGCR